MGRRSLASGTQYLRSTAPTSKPSALYGESELALSRLHHYRPGLVQAVSAPSAVASLRRHSPSCCMASRHIRAPAT